jgi:ferredoxin/pSer/pThr/pTyr-binding forkhead associated (FHA) protein
MNATGVDWLLEVLSPDGQVERAVELCEAEVDLGRSANGLPFADDSEMADRHARLRIRGDGVEISDTQEGSGVWIRVQGSEGRRLAANDQIWVGAQILVVVEEGGRWHLRHHGADGSPLDLHAIAPPGVFIGRGSELVLDLADRALSRRHAQIAVVDGALVLYDRGAHNGTYLKLNAPEILGPGDEFRLAMQHLRLAERGTAASVPGSGVVSEPFVASDASDASDARPRGDGLAARLRALGTSRARASTAQRAATDRPASAEEYGVGTEPSGAAVAHEDSDGETALVVIDSEDGSVSLEVRHGKTVLEAVQEAGLERGAPIDWECLDGRCGVCVVGVVEGADRLEPPDRESGEMRTIQITEQVTPDPNKYRLACLARVRGTVRLRRLT